MSGAVSLLKALEYIDSIGGYEIIEQVENELIEYTVEKWKKIKEKYDIKII
jgi:selenocysteine lyase/cysteine desulfurase